MEKYVIHKYPIIFGQEFHIDVPRNSRVLKVDYQREKNAAYIWVLKPILNNIESRRFIVIATGQEFEMKEWMIFQDTFFMHEFVWHLFELVNPKEKLGA
jgi:hypothetical protein